jgi:DNA-binding NarL/FixJ family response regulator
MSILIAEDNKAQRHYLSKLLTGQFAQHAPVIEATDGEDAVNLALEHRPVLCVLDIQMPKVSGVKAARTIWRELPQTRIIFWTQFPHEIYINEIRKVVRSISPQPTYGFIHKNNPESRLLRFIGTVLEDGADMIDPLFKDSFQRPLLTEFETEALLYLSLGLSNWAIARKCKIRLRAIESRLTNLYEKILLENPLGIRDEGYDKLAYNIRTKAFCEALKRGLINSEELEKAESEIADWLERDRQKYESEVKTTVSKHK